MSKVKRYTKQTPINQGRNEGPIYSFDAGEWGSSPVVNSVKVWEMEGSEPKTDVTSTCIPSGSASVAGTIVTLPNIYTPTAKTRYWVAVNITFGDGSILEPYFIIEAEY